MTAAPSAGRVAIDTGPLIYFLSGDTNRAPIVRRLLAAASRGEIQIVVSTITEAELLVAPLRQSDRTKHARSYTTFLRDRPSWTYATSREPSPVERRESARHGT